MATSDDQMLIQSNRDTQVAHDRIIGWTGIHEVLPDIPIKWILLDNESSGNLELVTSVRTVTEILELRINAENILSTQKYTVPRFGEAWFNPKAVTNIWSFAEVSDIFRII